MINVWDFTNAKRVKITDAGGNITAGKVICVMDSEENGEGEDDITIQTDGDTIIGFLQSEIKNIEII